MRVAKAFLGMMGSEDGFETSDRSGVINGVATESSTVSTPGTAKRLEVTLSTFHLSHSGQ